MIYLEKPKEFNAKFEIVSCFLERDRKILLLLRQDSKPQSNTWGVPAGKIESSESPFDAMYRELEEETGYKAYNPPLKAPRTIFVRYPDYDFVYYIFNLNLTENHDVLIDPKAHKDFKWVTSDEALEMNLIQDLDNCIKLTYGLNNASDRDTSI